MPTLLPAALPCWLLLAAAALAAGRGVEEQWPGTAWPRAEPEQVGLDPALLAEARDYALRGGGSGLITRHGHVIMAWGDLERRYDLKSTTKSIGFTAVGLALADRKVGTLADLASDYHPDFGVPPASNRATGWLDRVTLLHLATQTAGFEKPGGYGKLLFAPGSKWHYSDGGPNWLAECITLATGRDLQDLLFGRVFAPIGIARSDLTWRRNAYRPHEIRGIPRREFGSGIHANVDAMARIGILYVRRGRWRDRQLLPEEFVQAVQRMPEPLRGVPVLDEARYGKASAHYGLLWWNNADGTLKDVPRDAYWSWGLYDSLIVVVPSLDIVVARAGRSLKGGPGGHYGVLAPFLGPICRAARASEAHGAAPCAPSPVIQGIRWAPEDTILRLARGSDNWPVTWAEDDALYAAYGDGHGFEPKVPQKLSLGLARVLGSPPTLRGRNLRSPTGEQHGDGPRGRKASGMLFVDGVLYMWVRNANQKGQHAQLAWSRDSGRSWKWCGWRFTTTFGYPTFLNFGQAYAGARDDYVYVYSHDSPSAYTPADRMVLARAPKDRLLHRQAYEFFCGRDEAGAPRWSADVAERAAVFVHEGRCYRSGISYDAGLRRYLWVQILPGGDTRFQGGFGVYDAPEPWGPWTTAFFTERWDVGPGETATFPTKWMDADGKTLHLLFSGDDAFSVRRAELILRRRPRE